MSTTTANYGFIKPDFDEPSGPEELAENMIKSERALLNLETGSATGRQNIQMTEGYRNTSGTALNVNTEGAYDDLTWSFVGGTGTKLFDLDGNWPPPSLGVAWIFTGGWTFNFYHPGYYKINWNVRLQSSSTAMSEGLVRAAFLGSDGYNPMNFDDVGMRGAIAVVPINTMTNITDIGSEFIVKVVQRERVTQDGVSNALVTGSPNLYSYYGGSYFATFQQDYEIRVAHNNPSSATLTPLANESFVCIQWLRSL